MPSRPHITEYYPSTTAEGHAAIVCRVAAAPRDLASTILLWLFCMLSAAQIAVAAVAVIIAGLYLQPHRMCLLEDHPKEEQQACNLTFVACALTVPISAGVMVVELLPNRLVSPGVRNLVPLVLLILGTIIWGVQAATIHRNNNGQGDNIPGGQWRGTVLGLSWTNMALFLTAAVMKLFAPPLNSCIDSCSITLGRLCPEGCMPACDACCCLDVRTAKVPREVQRQGRVEVRFLSWNQEMIVAAGMDADEQMSRLDY